MSRSLVVAEQGHTIPGVAGQVPRRTGPRNGPGFEAGSAVLRELGGPRSVI